MSTVYDKLIIPPGKVTGCLPRVSRYGQWCSKLEDSIDIVPKEQWQQYIDEGVTLTPQVKNIFDQDGVRSCAFESTAQALQIIRSWGGQPFEKLNPWSGYCFTSGGKDRGSNIDTNLQHARDVGLLPMSVWPRFKGWMTKPSQELLDNVACNYQIDEFFDIATIDEVGTALLKCFPVVFGWQGHSCVLTSLVSTSVAQYVNSWGTDWGDNGFGQIRLNAINFGYGAFAVRTVVDSGIAT